VILTVIFFSHRFYHVPSTNNVRKKCIRKTNILPKKSLFLNQNLNGLYNLIQKTINSFDREVRFQMGQTIEALKKHGAYLTHKDLKEFDFILDTVNKNRFHNHISDNHTTYVANWQKDETEKRIYLVDLASHENFNFQKPFNPY